MIESSISYSRWSTSEVNSRAMSVDTKTAVDSLAAAKDTATLKSAIAQVRGVGRFLRG